MTEANARRTSQGAEVVTSEEVVNRLKERMKRRSLVPGQRLVETDIMRDTGASRGRVREALQRLAVEGLVVIEEFRGASVRQFTKEDARNINKTRELLEGLAARQFAESDDAEAKQRLAATQQAMDSAEAAGQLDAYARLNEDWHSLIIAGSRNPYIENFVDRLRLQVVRLQSQRFYANDGLKRSNLEHQQITAAIVGGDGAQAETLMRSHIRIGLEILEGLDDDYFS